MMKPTSLAFLFFICSHCLMERLTRTALADLILNTPGWARVGLTMPDARLRERAADAIAVTIAERLGFDFEERDERTLHLPLPTP